MKEDSIGADGGRTDRVTVVAPVASDALVPTVEVLDLVVKARIFLRGLGISKESFKISYQSQKTYACGVPGVVAKVISLVRNVTGIAVEQVGNDYT